MRKGINLQIQEVRLTLNSINPKKSTSKYTVIKLLKTNGKTGESVVLYTKERWIKWPSFSSETKEAKRRCSFLFFNLTFKEKNYQCSFLYQAKLCFGNKGEIKTFSEGKRRESSSNRSTLKNKSPSRKREMISVGNLQLQEWRMQNRNGRYLINIVDFFSY